MSIQYDRQKVEQWFGLVVHDLGATDLAVYWLYLAHGPIVPLPVAVTAHHPVLGTSLAGLWSTFSLWEQQAALYLFIPRIEANASHQAWLKSQKARVNEPL